MKMLFKVIGSLFVGTRYGVWGLSLLGIPLSLVLMFCNLSNGWETELLIFSALLLASSLTLILLPKVFIQEESLETNRFTIGICCMFVSVIIAGIIYLMVGKFPPINLIFY